MAASDRQHRFHKAAAAALFVYAALLIGMNLSFQFRSAFWGDEGFTIRLAKMSVPEMLAATASDVHPPLYYMFARLLYLLLGDHGYTWHLTAFLPYLAVMGFALTLVRRKWGLVPAAVFITFCSTLKNAVVYNQEVRNYALAAMFVLFAWYELLRILENNRIRDWTLFAVWSLGAAYTHYYALLTVAFYYAALLVLAVGKKVPLRRTLLICAVTIAGYLPWLAVLLQTFSRSAEGFWLSYIVSVGESLLYILGTRWVVLLLAAVTVLYVFRQFFRAQAGCEADSGKKELALHLRLQRREDARPSSELLWILAGLVSVLGTLAAGLILSYAVHPLFMARYLYPAAPVAWLILGICLCALPWRRICCLLLIALLLLRNIPQDIEAWQIRQERQEGLEAFLDAVVPSEDALLASDNSQIVWTLFEYYYPGIDSQNLSAAEEALNTGYDEIWLFWTEEPGETLADAANQQGYELTFVHEGLFADGTYYYAWRLVRE